LAVSLVCGWKINKNKKELVKFLDELGVEAKIAPAIYERFGTGTVELIKSNPYRLLAVMSWEKVDRIAYIPHPKITIFDYFLFLLKQTVGSV